MSKQCPTCKTTIHQNWCPEGMSKQETLEQQVEACQCYLCLHHRWIMTGIGEEPKL